MELEKLVSTYDDWSKVARREGPFILELEKHNQHLFYFGSNHSRDSNDIQYKELKEFWNKFLNITKGVNITVMVESSVRELRNTEEEAIKYDSEAGFMTYLAAIENVNIVSPELELKDQIDNLASKFDKDFVAYFFFLRVVPQYYRHVLPRPDFISYIKKFLNSYSIVAKWEQYDWSFENMKSIHKKIFNKEFDQNDIEFINKIRNPLNKESPFLAINRASTHNRDVAIVKEIKKHWDSEENLFIVLGTSHLFLQEKAIKTIVNNY